MCRRHFFISGKNGVFAFETQLGDIQDSLSKFERIALDVYLLKGRIHSDFINKEIIKMFELNFITKIYDYFLCNQTEKQLKGCK